MYTMFAYTVVNMNISYIYVDNMTIRVYMIINLITSNIFGMHF